MVERIVPATPALAAREQKAIDDLRALFPDGIVVGLDRKDGTLGKRLSALYRSLGYQSRADMIEALGFTQQLANRSGRPVTVDPEAVIAELQRRYEGKPKPKVMGILVHDNPDLASKLKSVRNLSNELFGHTLTVEFIERELLDKALSKEAASYSDEDLRRAVSELEEKYSLAVNKPSTLAQLKQREPDYVGLLDALDSKRSRALFGTTTARHFKTIGILSGGTAQFTDDEVLAALDALQELYRDKPNDEKPKALNVLMREHPEYADLLKAGQKKGLVSKDVLLKRGVLGLSQAALKARVKLLKERCVRNATLSELIRFYLGNGGTAVVLPDVGAGFLRQGVIGIDLGEEYELREVTFAIVGQDLSVGDSLQLHWVDLPSWYYTRKIALLKDDKQVGQLVRPTEDDFIDYRTYQIDSPLASYVDTTVIRIERLGDKQLARIRHRFLTRVSRETLLFALYWMGALKDAELYANDDAWRDRLEDLPQIPELLERAANHNALSGSSGEGLQGEELLTTRISESVPEEPPAPSGIDDEDAGDNVSDGQPDASVAEINCGTDSSGDDSEAKPDDSAHERKSVGKRWTFSTHQRAVGRRFSIEVPDQWVVAEDEGGRPLARYTEGIEDESECPEVIYSTTGDTDDETREAFRNNCIPEALIEMRRNAQYGNETLSAIARVVDDWLVEGKNCLALIFEVRFPSIFPGLTPDRYEYYVAPITYDHSDQLRLTDSYGFLGDGQLKELAFSVAATIELDESAKHRRPAELERFCVEQTTADAFCECVAIVSKNLNLGNNERMNANLWKEIRRANNDKTVLLANHRKERLLAEAYNTGLDEEVAYYERFVTALEKQAELGAPQLDKMVDIVRQFADAFIVDHVTIEDDEETAKAINRLGIISIPASYDELYARWAAVQAGLEEGKRPVAVQPAVADEEKQRESQPSAQEEITSDPSETSRLSDEEVIEVLVGQLNAFDSAQAFTSAVALMNAGGLVGVAGKSRVLDLLEQLWAEGRIRKASDAQPREYARLYRPDEWERVAGPLLGRLNEQAGIRRSHEIEVHKRSAQKRMADVEQPVAEAKRELEMAETKLRTIDQELQDKKTRMERSERRARKQSAVIAHAEGKMLLTSFFKFAKRRELRQIIETATKSKTDEESLLQKSANELKILEARYSAAKTIADKKRSLLAREEKRLEAARKNLEETLESQDFLDEELLTLVRDVLIAWASPVSETWLVEQMGKATNPKRAKEAVQLAKEKHVVANPTYDQHVLRELYMLGPCVWGDDVVPGHELALGRMVERNVLNILTWHVIKRDENSGTALLLCDYVVKAAPFCEGKRNATWPQCTLAAWLANELVNMVFTADERDLLVKKGDLGLAFALSATELKECKRVEGVTAPLVFPHSAKPRTNEWWLRDSASSTSRAKVATEAMNVSNKGRGVNSKSIGVRPAIWVRYIG